MEILNYEIVQKQCGTAYLYVLEDEQLFTKKEKSNRGTIYRCKNRSCGNRVQIIDNVCKRKIKSAHNENCGGKKEYMALKLEICLREKLIQNLFKRKSVTEILKENDIPNTSIKNKLYRLRCKLTPKKKNNIKSESTANSECETGNENTWSIIYIPKNTCQEENKNHLETELASTSNVLEEWNVLNQCIDNEQSSEASISNENFITESNTINSNDKHNIPPLDPIIEIDAIFFKRHKIIHNCFNETE